MYGFMLELILLYRWLLRPSRLTVRLMQAIQSDCSFDHHPVGQTMTPDVLDQ
jgi:hypothetical protein